MEAIISGTVTRSIIKPGKTMASTAIYTSLYEMSPTIISTKKTYPDGTRLKMRVSVTLFTVEGKSFLIVKETDDQTGVEAVK
jgi:hypothetical protein